LASASERMPRGCGSERDDVVRIDDTVERGDRLPGAEREGRDHRADLDQQRLARITRVLDGAVVSRRTLYRDGLVGAAERDGAGDITRARDRRRDSGRGECWRQETEQHHREKREEPFHEQAPSSIGGASRGGLA